MITPSTLQKRRSPRALRNFVIEIKESVRANYAELRLGIQKRGLYKEFLEEIVPLSLFALLVYPESHEIQPVLGNQGYDALVFDEMGKEVDRIEMTIPHDGKSASKDADLIVGRGCSQLYVENPGDDFDALVPYVRDICRKKAMKDYHDCTLVVAIEPMPPFASFEAQYEKQVDALASEIVKIKFKAKRVFILVLPDKAIRL